MFQANKRSWLKKSSLKILLCVTPLFYSSIASAQNNYTVLGYGGQIKEGDLIYLVYKAGGKVIYDSAIATNKRFSFSGSVTQPVRASLYRNEDPRTLVFAIETANVYLEPGTIKLNSPDTLRNAVTGGTPLNETFQLLQNRLSGNLRESARLNDPARFTEAEKQDTDLMNLAENEIINNFLERVTLELTFVKEYPGSYVSLEVLERNSRVSRLVNEVEEAYNVLDKSLQETPLGNKIRENIQKARRTSVGIQAKDFVMLTSKGQAISLSSFKGRYVLLDFWASWCFPCRSEHPNLLAAYKKYKDKGFTILSVSIDTDRDKWIKAIAADKVSWTQVSDLKGHNNEAYLLYGIVSIPANVLIDPQGTIIAKDLKGVDLQEKLAAIFEENK